MARLRRSPPGAPRSRVPRSQQPLPQTGQAAVSVALLRAADASNSDAYYAGMIDALNDYARRYAVDTPLRLAHFLAQIGHESGFRALEENGNYSAPRMREIFGCRGGRLQYDGASDECRLGPDGQPARLRPKLWLEASSYAGNPVRLLSYVYANRLGNSDEASGDGYRYRGRGLIQLTGKTNYAAFTEVHNARTPTDPHDFVMEPDLPHEGTQIRHRIGLLLLGGAYSKRACRPGRPRASHPRRERRPERTGRSRSTPCEHQENTGHLM